MGEFGIIEANGKTIMDRVQKCLILIIITNKKINGGKRC